MSCGSNQYLNDSKGQEHFDNQDTSRNKIFAT